MLSNSLHFAAGQINDIAVGDGFSGKRNFRDYTELFDKQRCGRNIAVDIINRSLIFGKE